MQLKKLPTPTRHGARGGTTKSYQETTKRSGVGLGLGVGVGGSGHDGDWCSAEQLEAAREAYLEEQQQHAPAPAVKLRYAIALVKSSKRDDKLRGVALLDDLLASGVEAKECLYWLALTSYSLGEYRASRAHCESLLRLEPTHTRALALHQCIKDVTANDQMMGLGLVSAVVVAGIALKLLLKR